MKSVLKGKSKLMSEPEPSPEPELKLFESRSGNKKFRLHNTNCTDLPASAREKNFFQHSSAQKVKNDRDATYVALDSAPHRKLGNFFSDGKLKGLRPLL
jgi:hypothetical protein